MKTSIHYLKVTLLILAVTLSTTAMAKRHIITASGISFTPASILTVEVGDTMVWVWGSGVHTTTSGVIPAEAISWDAPLTSTSTVFIYPVTIPGNYNYVCTFHAAMGMVGSFTARAPSAIPDPSAGTPAINVYPNPFSGTLYYNFDSKGQNFSRLEIYNVTGAKVFEQSEGLHEGIATKVDLGSLNSGIYFLKFIDSENHSWVRRVSKE